MDHAAGPLDLSMTIADAIARRDVGTLAGLLADGFVYRAPGGPSVNAEAFLKGIEQIPGEILFVRLDALQMDMVQETAALVTGVQHAQVRVGVDVIDDRRAFVDLFERTPAGWRIRTAVDLPGPVA